MKEKAFPLVATVDNGGILRCRTGAKLLESWGIPAKPYAARDTSKQTYKGKVPLHVVGLFRSDLGIDIWGESIESIPQDVAERVHYFLVYCGLDALPHFIDPKDSRICYKPVCDITCIGDIEDYRRAMREVAAATLEFVEEKFPHIFIEDVAIASLNEKHVYFSVPQFTSRGLNNWPDDYATMI